MRRILLEGEKFKHDDPVMVMWREYKMARLFGWLPAQTETVDGEWIDWAIELSREFPDA